MFSPSNELVIFGNTGCSFVKVISYCLNPNFVLNACVGVILQSVITLIDNFPSIKIVLGCFFGLSTSSYLFFYMI